MIRNVIEFIFAAALFLNAVLFIPQALKIYTEKSARSVSLITFLGFLIIQVAIVSHALLVHDYLLMGGYVLSLVTCGSVVALAFFYKKKKSDKIHGLTLEEIVSQLPGNVYWKDMKLDFIGANTNNWKDFGFSSYSEYKGKTDYDIFPKAEADKVRLLDEEVIRTREPRVAEERLTNSKGEVIDFLSHKKPLLDKKGRVVGVLGCSVDITKAKKVASDKLAMLDNIISVMPGNVYWMNRDGVYLGCNDNEAKAVGLDSRKDIVGKRNVDISEFVIPEALDLNNEQVFEKGITITSEEPAVLPNGEKAVFLSNKTPIHDSQGNIIGLVGISIDITDRKRQEKELGKARKKAEESNKIKSDFISNMEHDIRTPFVGVYGMVKILAERETDSEKKELLEDVSLCAKELMDYCDGILDFSIVESEEMVVQSKRLSLKEVVHSVILIESVAAKGKNLDLRLKYDDGLPDTLVGDPHRLKRILLNLVSNAIKFTKEGHVTLSAKLHAYHKEQRKVIVELKVEDTGVGIPDDKKEFVYERFSKVTPSNKGIYKGLGLGLRIVKQFVAELDGEIELESEIGVGSRFSIFIPLFIPLSNDFYKE